MPRGRANSYAGADADSRTDARADSESDPDTHSKTDAHTYTYTHANTDTHANPHANPHADSIPHSHAMDSARLNTSRSRERAGKPAAPRFVRRVRSNDRHRQ
jgi:hypothetical protein